MKSKTTVLPSNKPERYLLDASKPPEGAGVVDAGSAPAAEAGAPGTAEAGGAADEMEPKASKPVSRRLFCTGAKAGARAGAALGASVGEIRPEGHHTHSSNYRLKGTLLMT